MTVQSSMRISRSHRQTSRIGFCYTVKDDGVLSYPNKRTTFRSPNNKNEIAKDDQYKRGNTLRCQKRTKKKKGRNRDNSVYIAPGPKTVLQLPKTWDPIELDSDSPPVDCKMRSRLCRTAASSPF
jgi:hypothetical protein